MELGVDTLNKALVAPSAYYVVLLCYVIKYVKKKISIEKKINESENDACMRQEWHSRLLNVRSASATLFSPELLIN